MSDRPDERLSPRTFPPTELERLREQQLRSDCNRVRFTLEQQQAAEIVQSGNGIVDTKALGDHLDSLYNFLFVAVVDSPPLLMLVAPPSHPSLLDPKDHYKWSESTVKAEQRKAAAKEERFWLGLAVGFEDVKVTVRLPYPLWHDMEQAARRRPALYGTSLERQLEHLLYEAAVERYKAEPTAANVKRKSS